MLRPSDLNGQKSLRELSGSIFRMIMKEITRKISPERSIGFIISLTFGGRGILPFYVGPSFLSIWEYLN